MAGETQGLNWDTDTSAGDGGSARVWAAYKYGHDYWIEKDATGFWTDEPGLGDLREQAQRELVRVTVIEQEPRFNEEY